MQASFWHQLWDQGEIAFHESQANPALVKHIDSLKLIDPARVFLPLCGKTLDIAWLLGRGHQVVGVELSALAIDELFQELGINPTITTVGTLRHYSADNIDIWVGDFFGLTHELLGPVDAIYDRGALVALPADMRKQYTAHLMTISRNAQQLLIAYEYDQNLYAGPPFSLTRNELSQHYGDTYQLELLERSEVIDGFKDRVEAVTCVWRFHQNGSSR